MKSEGQVYRWDDLAADQPMTLIDRKRIIGEKMMISHVTLHEGFAVPTHQHENEQFAVVLSGRIRFLLNEGRDDECERILEGGEVLHLPANVPHAATALETTVILDLFSPPSATTGVDTPSAS